ncbi:MAG: GspE/PulE family protein [Planctomycetaceae bacterium]
MELTPYFQQALPPLREGDPQAATQIVDAVLQRAKGARASDIHLVPGPSGLAMHWRIDGVLQPVWTFGPELGPRLTARLKVLSHLLTYRTDVPQEGRIVAGSDPTGVETRVSSFPTLHGEKVVVRLFQQATRHRLLADLGLPPDIEQAFRNLLDRVSGLVLVVGPAGSGKSTTAYAARRELVEHTAGQRSLVSLEDPIEVEVPGVAQSQVNPAAGFDLVTGLRSLMRQDPEVISIGEIRDAATAQVAVQAALTGHLVLSTFHAHNAHGALQRLHDLEIDPALLRGLVRGILAQRLLRRLCPCGVATSDPADLLGWPVEAGRRPVGCPACLGTGYHGRFPLAELLTEHDLQSPAGDPRRPGDRAAPSRSLENWDWPARERAALERGWASLAVRGLSALRDGLTSAAELHRALGSTTPPPSHSPSATAQSAR